MTPDDIRLANFDTTRRGYDTDQVRDLLARAAFALECSMRSSLAQTNDAPSAQPVPPAAAAVPPAAAAATTAGFDHEALAERLGQVITAAEELVMWKRRLDDLRDEVRAPHQVVGLPVFDDIWGGRPLPTMATGNRPTGTLSDVAGRFEMCPAEEWRHGR